ncbi:MAG: SPOR domain-containing protein [Azoarcus sp.]|nr:SPOR domain-containing protein [Azoarcus sp.]
MPIPASGPPVPASAPDDDQLGALIADAVAVDSARNASNSNASAGTRGQNLFLQLGVFSSRENAENFRIRAEARVTGLTGKLELVAEGEHFRLYAGPYASPGDAHAEAERIGGELGIQLFTVQRNER